MKSFILLFLLSTGAFAENLSDLDHQDYDRAGDILTQNGIGNYVNPRLTETSILVNPTNNCLINEILLFKLGMYPRLILGNNVDVSLSFLVRFPLSVQVAHNLVFGIPLLGQALGAGVDYLFNDEVYTDDWLALDTLQRRGVLRTMDLFEALMMSVHNGNEQLAHDIARSLTNLCDDQGYYIEANDVLAN